MVNMEVSGPASAPALSARPVRFGDTVASVLLDLVRALAALVVVAEHWRNMLFVDYHQLPSHRLLWAVPYLLTAAGHQAVVIFFVLSGYLISGSIFRALDRGRWSWATYMTHRLVRLWVVVVPGLLLCAACDTFGAWLHHAPLLYGGLGNDHMTPNVLAACTLPIFLGNVFFLQSIHVPTFGSDGALWSLADEFWYYALFPLGLFALRRSSLLKQIAYATGLLAAGWFVGLPVLISFPIWLLGVVLGRCKPPRFGAGVRFVRWIAALAYAPLVFILARFGLVQGITSDLLLGVATSLFLWILLSATQPADGGAKRIRWTRFLARGSFSLYVVHLPLLLLFTSLVAGDGRFVPSLATIPLALGGLAVVLCVAYGFASVTEFRTDGIRRWVEGRLGLAE